MIGPFLNRLYPKNQPKRVKKKQQADVVSSTLTTSLCGYDQIVESICFNRDQAETSDICSNSMYLFGISLLLPTKWVEEFVEANKDKFVKLPPFFESGKTIAQPNMSSFDARSILMSIREFANMATEKALNCTPASLYYKEVLSHLLKKERVNVCSEIAQSGVLICVMIFTPAIKCCHVSSFGLESGTKPTTKELVFAKHNNGCGGSNTYGQKQQQQQTRGDRLVRRMQQQQQRERAQQQEKADQEQEQQEELQLAKEQENISLRALLNVRTLLRWTLANVFATQSPNGLGLHLNVSTGRPWRYYPQGELPSPSFVILVLLKFSNRALISRRVAVAASALSDSALNEYTTSTKFIRALELVSNDVREHTNFNIVADFMFGLSVDLKWYFEQAHCISSPTGSPLAMNCDWMRSNFLTVSPGRPWSITFNPYRLEAFPDEEFISWE
jgi:hypothetical protein